MKREQIIEILERFITESEDYPDCILRYNFSRVADAILTLPLEVPSDEELYEWAGYCAGNTTENHDKRIVYQAALVLGAKWMKDEIINLNDTK